ncbi:hypothetical protein KTD31_02485 [Burkholderia multivorans]|uniref:hypothetical protein n=1 Tax=Burkholderia multivorans TaxID=87883 RepID=UPI001C22EA2D|nr:hypothetical protein [Burkholderia multivorans]MBU9200273.1 hypothetical protein [Burkholderia multivorans]MDN8078600.1 hypothetical protein [Burkholderia multivorans]
MSLFQCHSCGCCENTATSNQGFSMFPESFDWSGKEALKGFRLCSACGPTRFKDGTATGGGKWHDVFARVFLPKGMFKTNKRGNLEHIETGSEDYRSYALARGD